jgi:uncharacterized protein (TIGR02147 family)
MIQAPAYRSYLQAELARRCDRNPRYSLRAFSLALGLSPGALSELLSGKRVPSVPAARRILSRLGLEPDRERELLASVERARAERNPVLKAGARATRPAAAPVAEIDLDAFRIIGDWYHMAILFLTDVEGFQPDPRWISGALGISATEAALAVERLVRLGMLRRHGARLRRAHRDLATSGRDRTTAAHRRHQRQILEKAIHSLENEPLENRSNTGLTFAANPARLPEARRMIEGFQRRLCRTMQGGRKTALYQLSLAVFPLQKSPSPAKKRKK